MTLRTPFHAFVGLLMVGAIGSGCHRIELSPPDAGEPLLAFEIVTADGNIQANEATGSWSYSIDTTAGYVDHTVAYEFAANGERWELVHHVPQGDGANVISPGVLEHRPSMEFTGLGTASVSEAWLNALDWVVQGELVEEGATTWSVGEDGSLEIELSLEVEVDGEEALEQEIEVACTGLQDACGNGLIPGLFEIHLIEGDWWIAPPVSTPGIVWNWEVDGEAFQSWGDEWVELDVDDDDDQDLEIVLQSEDPGHVFGVFSIHRHLSWEDNWMDEFTPFLTNGLSLSLVPSESHPWMELRHRTAQNEWFTSELTCGELDNDVWRFDVLEVTSITSHEVFEGKELVRFAAVLPYRLEGDFSEEPVTVSVSGAWPFEPAP